MSSIAATLARTLRVSCPATPASSLGLRRAYCLLFSTEASGSDNDGADNDGSKGELDDFFTRKPELEPQGVDPKRGAKNDGIEGEFDDFLTSKPEPEPQGVDPKRGWGFRGVHKAILCGKVGQAPVQKILRNGRTVTIFTVGTGGMYDQRVVPNRDLPRPPQWHRIAIHNENLGAYAVQQLTKNSPVYVEGDIETRVYNDSISGEVKNVPEICVRRDGRVRRINAGESISSISFDDLKEGLM